MKNNIESKEWYGKAKELFQNVISGDGFFLDTPSIYGLWFDLLELTNEAHKKNDIDFLKKVYSFAEWCYNSTEDDNSNAVAVSFYEHLVDDEKTMKEMVNWISKDVVQGVMCLWERQLSNSKEKYEDLVKYLKINKKL